MGRTVYLSLLTLLICLAVNASATTYYVAANGNDANNGTSKTTPWLHAPGMTGCTGVCASASPKPGDQFILRGGDTWNYTNLPWTWNWSGATNNRVYLGVDQSWYSGSAFAKPKLDGQFLCCTDGSGLLIIAGGVSHITIDNFEITGLMMVPPNGNSASIALQNTTQGDVFMTNLYVHNWNRCTGAGKPSSICTGAVTDNSWNAGGIQGSAWSNGPSMAGVIIDHSEVGDPENGGNIGSAAHNIEQVNYSYIHDAGSGCKQGCRIVHDSTFANIGNTFDGSSHMDVIYADTFGAGSTAPSFQSYIYNNLITGSTGNATNAIIYPNPYTSGATSSVEFWIFNNVVYGGGNGIGDNIDPYNPGSATLTAKVHDWNNTYVSTSINCVVLTGGAGRSAIDTLDVQNLHCISPNAAVATNIGVTHLIQNNIVTQSSSQASAQGYTSSEFYAPTSSTGSTVGAGVSLSAQCAGTLTALCTGLSLYNPPTTGYPRPAAGVWDAGAYEFDSSSTTNPPSGLTDVVK